MATGAAARGGRRTLRGAGAGLLAAALVALLAAAAPAAAQQGGQARGPVTGLPLPRYVSLEASRANLRRGPGLDYRIDWVFVRPGLPLEVTAEYGHWRRVRDMEGASGWMHHSMLRGRRTAVTVPELTEIRAEPRADAPLAARAGAGVILEVEACRRDWCRLRGGEAEGWAEKSALWGVGAEEEFD